MYIANENRYNTMEYRHCGQSGLSLSLLSLGLWHNFGSNSDKNDNKEIIHTAFDNGIISFDLANNYGPPNGEAESRFGEIISSSLKPYRDEILISTKAGYKMWDGPNGDGGSKKYLISSLDQSLKRMRVDYVDIFYHHRPDANTPIEETADSIAYAVNSGRALYVALSNYGEDFFLMEKALERYHIKPILNQVSYSILNRRGDPSGTLFKSLKEDGVGVVAFSPLSQGRLTDKYLSHNIPTLSRANENNFLKREDITPEVVKTLNELNALAKKRGQSLLAMALNWVLSQKGMTSAIVGARNKEQLKQSIQALSCFSSFSLEEFEIIDKIARKVSFRR